MKKRPTILFFFILIVIIAAGILLQQLLFKKAGTAAVISQHGSVVATLPLSADTQLTLEDGSGGSNTIVIKNGAVSVTEADCADKICVNTGKISKTGEVIACLPHELIITISGEDGAAIDATAG